MLVSRSACINYMVQKIIEAAFKYPRLLAEVPLNQLSPEHCVSVVNVLAANHVEPPLLYRSICQSILRNHPKYSPYRTLFQNLDSGSFTGFVSSFVQNAYKPQSPGTRFSFSRQEKLQLIKHLRVLYGRVNYRETAGDLLSFLCDALIDNTDFLTPNESAQALESLLDIEGISSIDTLKVMCKANIITNIDLLTEECLFYTKGDVFHEVLKLKFSRPS